MSVVVVTTAAYSNKTAARAIERNRDKSSTFPNAELSAELDAVHSDVQCALLEKYYNQQTHPRSNNRASREVSTHGI